MPKKRVIFCTYPSLYSELVLKELLKANGELELVGVVRSTRVLNKNFNAFQSSLSQLRRSGLRYSAYLWVITDLYYGLARLRGAKSLNQCLESKGIPVLSTKDINADGVDFIRGLRADVMLSAHFNQLIAPELLNLPGLTCLNIHPSLLPAFKGVDPAFYALLRGRQQTGVTLHEQNAEFDNGDILEQQAVQVRWHDTLLSLNVKLFKLGALAVVRQIVSVGENTGKHQQVGEGDYDSWPTPQVVRQFRKQRKLFRWKEYWALVKLSRRPR